MDPNFTPGSEEHEQQLFQEQQDFLYSVLISSLKTEFSEALVKDHEGDAQLILELLHEHHTGNFQYSRAEINRITKYLTNIKLDDTWRGTNESFLMHYNDQLFSTSPDTVKLLQQTPSSLTLLLLMMVPPWPNSSVAVILLSVMHMASNQPNNSSTPSLITSENREPWIPSSVMKANMKSPSKSLISSIPSSSKIISLNLITNTKIRLKIVLDLPSITPTLS